MLDSWIKFTIGDKSYVGKVIKEDNDFLICKVDGENHTVEKDKVEVLVEGSIVRKARR